MTNGTNCLFCKETIPFGKAGPDGPHWRGKCKKQPADNEISIAKAIAIGSKIGNQVAEAKRLNGLARSTSNRELAGYYRERAKRAAVQIGKDLV